MALTVKQQCAFLIELGEMLHRYGTPAFRLESHLKSVAEHLGLDGYFLVSPTTLTFCLWLKGAPDDTVYNYSMRVMPSGLDLGLLARTNDIVNQLVAGECTLEEAGAGLKTIQQSKPPYSRFVSLLAFVMSAGAFSVLMRSSWHDALWACLLSTLAFMLIVAAEKSTRVEKMLEPLSSTLIALIAVGAAQLDPGINPPLIVLSSIIIFIPGLSLTIGFRELAARELISGTARIMDALMVLFKLYFGSVLGTTVGVLLWGDITPADMPAVPSWTQWPTVLILSSALIIAFKVRLSDALWCIASGILAYAVCTLATEAWGITLGAFLGAFSVGIYANLFASWRNAPSALVALPGIVILVPGSKVYVGLEGMVTGNQIVMIDQIGVQSFLIFMSLVAGLVFANALLEPKRAL